MRPAMKYFKLYGRAYIVYVAVKWSILGSVFILLSEVEGFSLSWLLWWPVVGVPTALTYNAHRLHAKKQHGSIPKQEFR